MRIQVGCGISSMDIFFFLGYKKVLALQALISGLPKVEKHKNIFEECAKGKHTRENFSKDNAWRAHRPLQFVHLDIFGPMQTKSLGKLSYFIIFIDDYSQKWWVYFLKTKDEALDMFQEV